MIGSGPFRYKAGERVAVVRNVYERFAGYNPRHSGLASGTAVLKVVHYGGPVAAEPKLRFNLWAGKRVASAGS
jgi:hypothetical protein